MLVLREKDAREVAEKWYTISFVWQTNEIAKRYENYTVQTNIHFHSFKFLILSHIFLSSQFSLITKQSIN
jgi:hypothetical protein